MLPASSRQVACTLFSSKINLLLVSEPGLPALWRWGREARGRHHLVPANSFTLDAVLSQLDSSSSVSFDLTPGRQVNMNKSVTYRAADCCKTHRTSPHVSHRNGKHYFLFCGAILSTVVLFPETHKNFVVRRALGRRNGPHSLPESLPSPTACLMKEIRGILRGAWLAYIFLSALKSFQWRQCCSILPCPLQGSQLSYRLLLHLPKDMLL